MKILALPVVLAFATLNLTACEELKKEDTQSTDASSIHVLCAGQARIAMTDLIIRTMLNKVVPYEFSFELDEENGKVLALTETALTVGDFSRRENLPDTLLDNEFMKGIGGCFREGTKVVRDLEVTHAEFTISLYCPRRTDDLETLHWVQSYAINRLDGSFQFGGGYIFSRSDGSRGIKPVIEGGGDCAVPSERRF